MLLAMDTSRPTVRGSNRINWCFTINNYSDSMICALKGLHPGKARYIIYGKEKGANGTPHLQGYIQFINRQRLTAVKKMPPFDKAHLEPMMARDPEQASSYCKKDGDFTEIGEMDRQGQRKDILTLAEQFRKERSFTNLKDQPAWYQFQNIIQKQVEKEDLERHFEEQKAAIRVHRLKVWQANITEVLLGPVNPRTIHWIYDIEGNTGKSWFSRWLVLLLKALRLENGKNADIKHAYNGQKIVVFDFARTICDRVNYEVIESIKNGIFFSSKYNSSMKVFNSPHVLCLANFRPQEDKLSADRWDIQEIHNYEPLDIDLCTDEQWARILPFIEPEQASSSSRSETSSDVQVGHVVDSYNVLKYLSYLDRCPLHNLMTQGRLAVFHLSQVDRLSCYLLNQQ